MLLRASSDAIDAGADVHGAVGGATGNVPHGGLLMAYAEAANRDPEAARALDDEVIAAVGEAGLVDAAVIVACSTAWSGRPMASGYRSTTRCWPPPPKRELSSDSTAMPERPTTPVDSLRSSGASRSPDTPMAIA